MKNIISNMTKDEAVEYLTLKSDNENHINQIDKKRRALKNTANDFMQSYLSSVADKNIVMKADFGVTGNNSIKLTFNKPHSTREVYFNLYFRDCYKTGEYKDFEINGSTTNIRENNELLKEEQYLLRCMSHIANNIEDPVLVDMFKSLYNDSHKINEDSHLYIDKIKAIEKQVEERMMKNVKQAIDELFLDGSVIRISNTKKSYKEEYVDVVYDFKILKVSKKTVEMRTYSNGYSNDYFARIDIEKAKKMILEHAHSYDFGGYINPVLVSAEEVSNLTKIDA